MRIVVQAGRLNRTFVALADFPGPTGNRLDEGPVLELDVLDENDETDPPRSSGTDVTLGPIRSPELGRATRLRDELLLYGVASSSVWPRLIEGSNAPLGVPVVGQPDNFLPSDSTPFARAHYKENDYRRG